MVSCRKWAETTTDAPESRLVSISIHQYIGIGNKSTIFLPFFCFLSLFWSYRFMANQVICVYKIKIQFHLRWINCWFDCWMNVLRAHIKIQFIVSVHRLCLFYSFMIFFLVSTIFLHSVDFSFYFSFFNFIVTFRNMDMAFTYIVQLCNDTGAFVQLPEFCSDCNATFH